MYNKMFSILTREKGILREVSRSFQPDNVMKNIHNALVPDNGITPFTDYAAEQLIQCVRSSYMKDAAAAFDPLSRYNYPLSFPTIFEYSLNMLQDNIDVSYRKIPGYSVNMNMSTVMEINADTGTIVFVSGNRSGEVVNYTVTDGVSENIPLTDRVTFCISDLISGQYTVILSYKLPFTRTLLDIKNELPASVSSKYEYMRYNNLPDYIAGITMDVCYTQEKIK